MSQIERDFGLYIYCLQSANFLVIDFGPVSAMEFA